MKKKTAEKKVDNLIFMNFFFSPHPLSKYYLKKTEWEAWLEN